MAIEQDEKYTQLAPRPYPLPHTHTHAPPKMQPSYAYPPPQGQAGSEHYRQSPSNMNAPPPPVSLPPLRSIESQAPPAPAHLLQQGGNRHMGQASPSMHGYYSHPQAGLSHPGQSLPPFARYAAIPPGTPIGGSRGKKEIKRRTKTGCLTCRKRRIKCDEEHPACRNCQKSKRECLGYDPIFKQQPGPPPLQPAPGTTTDSVSPSPSTATSGAGSYSPAQVVYPPMPHSYPSTPQSAPVPPPIQPNSSQEARAAIDPALARSPKVERKVFEQKVVSLPPSDRMDSPKMKPARQLDMNQLFQIGQCGPYELTGSVAVDDEALKEIQHYYLNDLAPGLDRLLETDYFTTSGGGRLLATRSLLSEIAELLRHFTQVGGPNMAQDEYRCRATEARAVWHILTLCKPDVDVNSKTAAVIDMTTPHGRLDVLEALLTNRQLSQENLKTQNADLFWVELAKFLTNRVDDPAAAVDADHSLHQCRTRLSGRENRDVIYSLMVTRHHAWKVSGFPHSMHPESGGESSHVNKVYIAHKFIADEAGYRGTNHPIQRICDMAMRSWAIGW